MASWRSKALGFFRTAFRFVEKPAELSNVRTVASKYVHGVVHQLWA